MSCWCSKNRNRFIMLAGTRPISEWRQLRSTALWRGCYQRYSLSFTQCGPGHPLRSWMTLGGTICPISTMWLRCQIGSESPHLVTWWASTQCVWSNPTRGKIILPCRINSLSLCSLASKSRVRLKKRRKFKLESLKRKGKKLWRKRRRRLVAVGFLRFKICLWL